MSPTSIELIVSQDPAVAAAGRIAELLAQAVHERGHASLALSGGSSPLPMFDALVSAPLDWARVDVLQVDERVAVDGHPDRNATALLHRLVEPAVIPPERVHLIGVAGSTPERAAADYRSALQRVTGSPRPVLDVVHLGLGADGHTASLVPGDPVLEVTDTDVAATGVYAGRRRVTMTYPLLDRAAWRVWLVPSAGKAEALSGLLAGDRSMPAGRIRRDQSVVITDR